MLSHFVIEYIQDETYLKLRYFWRYKSNLRGHQQLGYYNIFTVWRRTISVACVVVRICTLYHVLVGFAAAYIWYTYVSENGKPWPVPLRVYEVKNQDGVLSLTTFPPCKGTTYPFWYKNVLLVYAL